MIKISNVEIAEIIAKKGYNFQKVLTSIDAGRNQEEEQNYIEEAELVEIISGVILSFECEQEY